MIKTRLRVTSGLLWVAFTLLSLYPPHPATAETYIANAQTRDFYFSSSEPMTMTVRTYAQQYGIDSMLWVYEGNTIVTANDDYYGLDSQVVFNMSPDIIYRLRTGVCCGNPDAWYGNSYVIEPSLAPTNVLPPQTTTTEATQPTQSVPESSVVPEIPTTSTSTSTTTTSVLTTTTTSTTTTLLVSTTTEVSVPPTTLPDTPEETSTTSSSLLPSTTAEPVTTTTRPAPVPTTTTSSSTTTIPPTTTTTSITPQEDLPVVAITSEQLKEALAEGALQKLPQDELEEFFENIDFEQLTEEQQEVFIETLNDAEENVKKAFESTVNIYSGEFEEYVPSGSTVPVKTRKAIIAVTGVLFAAPAVSSSSTSGSSSRKR